MITPIPFFFQSENPASRLDYQQPTSWDQDGADYRTQRS